ncbi:MAG: hypothetical protein ACAF41_17735 [Leptolyngbya sp. BL-A-14]
MSSFVNFLKNLLSGIFSFLGGLFGGKKQEAIAGAESKPRKARNSGYFLELDDAKGVGNGAATAPKPEAVKTAAKSESAKVDTVTPASPSEAAKPQASKSAAAVEKVEPKHAATNAALNLPQPTVTTFAPKYLAPTGSSNGRRRPGANMSSFLDMARQVKTSS